MPALWSGILNISTTVAIKWINCNWLTVKVDLEFEGKLQCKRKTQFCFWGTAESDEKERLIAEERRSKVKERATGDTHSLVRLSMPQKAPLVSSIVPEMSLRSSSLWRMREIEGDENDGRRKRGTVSPSTEALHSPNRRGWSGSHGLPHGHYSLHHPPLLHLALRAALPTKSILSLE